MPRILLLGLPILVALAVAACSPAATSPAGGGGGGAASATVNITDAKSPGFFDPASVTVKAGQSVQWVDQSNLAHSVKWQDGTPDSPTLNKGGAPYTRTFSAAGTFPYVCGIHGATMSGSVIVQP